MPVAIIRPHHDVRGKNLHGDPATPYAVAQRPGNSRSDRNIASRLRAEIYRPNEVGDDCVRSIESGDGCYERKIGHLRRADLSPAKMIYKSRQAIVIRNRSDG